MFGEGDLMRHLSQLTYKLMYHQDPLAEYDFSLISMSTDLQDGVRLCKMAEALTGRWHPNYAKVDPDLSCCPCLECCLSNVEYLDIACLCRSVADIAFVQDTT